MDPTEIAHLIIDQLYTADGPADIPSISLANLKALRLNCKNFRRSRLKLPLQTPLAIHGRG